MDESKALTHQIGKCSNPKHQHGEHYREYACTDFVREKVRYYSTHLLESRRSVRDSKMQLAEWARAQGFTPVAYETQGNYIRLFVR